MKILTLRKHSLKKTIIVYLKLLQSDLKICCMEHKGDTDNQQTDKGNINSTWQLNQQNNNSVNKSSKWSNNAAILIIHAPLHAGNKVNGTESQNPL